MAGPIVGLPPDLVISEEVVILSDETWHLPRDKFRPIRQVSAGKGVRVAVLDTGYWAHPTLPTPLATRSFINGESVEDTRSGHGTHTAGTVLSRDEDIGVATDAELIVGKVLSNSGSGSSSGIAAGINWAIESGADVISMSLGGPSPYEPTIQAIKRALSRGIIVVIAAGNSGYSGNPNSNTIGYPARSGEGVCVAALSENGKPANFSSGGSQMTIAAPGQNILSTNNGVGFRLMSGTSMATPFVAGSFALIISHARRQGDPSFTSIQAVNKFIQVNSVDMGTPGWDPATGFGQFDMLKVLEKLSEDALLYV